MNYLEKAELTAAWICRNQYRAAKDWEAKPYKQFDMNEDMNFGRFVRNYNITAGRITHLSTNWLSGMTLHGLLALYDYFGRDDYLKAALDGSHYLKCLQNTMEARPESQGAFNERIASNRWCAPRDALSAAWGLLRLHRSSGDAECLSRAELFARWYAKNVFVRDSYPCAYYFFDGQPHDTTLYSCQGGGALFYFDLYRLTAKEEYLRTALKIVEYYIVHFLNDDGSVNIVYDPDTGLGGDGDASDAAWNDMHKYNDDFGFLAALAAYAVTRDDKYFERARRYMDWVVDQQKDDGSFGTYSLSVSSCVSALNLMNFFLLTKDDKYLEAGFKAMRDLERSVVESPGDPAVHGGILGMDVAEVAANNDILCLRVSQYALQTFLLYGIYDEHVSHPNAKSLPPRLLENPLLIGLLYV